MFFVASKSNPKKKKNQFKINYRELLKLNWMDLLLFSQIFFDIKDPSKVTKSRRFGNISGYIFEINRFTIMMFMYYTQLQQKSHFQSWVSCLMVMFYFHLVMKKTFIKRMTGRCLFTISNSFKNRKIYSM